MSHLKKFPDHFTNLGLMGAQICICKLNINIRLLCITFLESKEHKENISWKDMETEVLYTSLQE